MKRPTAQAPLASATAPALLAERARREPRGVAFRSKHLGLYRERTWSDYCDLVARCALGLGELGLERGSRLAIMGDPCEEWLICDMASQAAGAIPFGIHPTAAEADVERQLQDSGAAVFVAETQEHVDRVLPLLDRLPALKAVVVIDTSAMFAFDQPILVGFDRVVASGEGRLKAAGGGGIEAVARLAGDLDSDATAFLVYTQDPSGRSRGARIGHGAHLAAARGFVERYPRITRPGHRTVAYLPLCDILGRQAALTLPLISGLVPHFGERQDAVSSTLFEVAPTVLFTVPRFLQMVASRILLAVEDTSWVKRKAYERAVALGRNWVRKRWEGSPTVFAGALHRMLHWAALRPILNKIGFDQLELVISSGAPLPPEIMALWQLYGVNVAEVYCPAGTSGAPVAAHPGAFPRPGSAMSLAPGWSVELGEGGEILVKGAEPFRGYGDGEGAWEAGVDAAGWLHTGDIGERSGGALRIVDRARDPIATASGRPVVAARLEDLLTESPYVAHAVVVGHGRKHLAALLEIDAAAVAEWARSRGARPARNDGVDQDPEVLELLQGEVDRVNARVARFEQIRAFRVVPVDGTPGSGKASALRERGAERRTPVDRFHELVKAMYDGQEERRMAEAVGDILR